MESNCSNRIHVNGFPLGYCDHNLLCVAIIRVVPLKDTLTTKTKDKDQGPKREAKYERPCFVHYIFYLKSMLESLSSYGHFILFFGFVFLVKDA
jgi:hypothetical protein